MTSQDATSGTTSGPHLLLPLSGPGLRSQLEDRLRQMVRDGTLAPGERLPSTRALAGDLGVSRRLVVEAYSQLLAEGYLVAQQGSATYVAGAAATAPLAEPALSRRPRLRYDFFPGSPDIGAFPRSLWLRALRDTLRGAPPEAFGYPEPRGTPELRNALAGHLRRSRGVAADPRTIVICAGATQALSLLGRALVQLGGDCGAVGGNCIAVEDPGFPQHREVLRGAGLEVRGVPVDEEGIDVGAIDAPAVLVTPAHQSPTGVAMSAARRAALIDWARQTGGLVVEDDYDAEFRYDRAPLGALQGLAPDHVVYMGTVSKTLAPALRIGWLVLPARLARAVAHQKFLHDFGSPPLEQLALASLIESAAYDRELRRARRRNRARRDALIAAVEREIPGARVGGVSAGLHGLVRLPEPVDAAALVREANSRSVGVYPLSFHMIEPPPETDAVVLGYASLPEPAIAVGVRLLAEALAAAPRG